MWRLKSFTYYLAFFMIGVAVMRSGFLFYNNEMFINALLVIAVREKTYFQGKNK